MSATTVLLDCGLCSQEHLLRTCHKQLLCELFHHSVQLLLDRMTSLSAWDGNKRAAALCTMAVVLQSPAQEPGAVQAFEQAGRITQLLKNLDDLQLKQGYCWLYAMAILQCICS